ncbi:MAG: type II secretion system protein J [Bacillota bacterium]
MPFGKKRLLPVTALRNESGLTLLEVIASLALMALILGVLSQFLYSSNRLKIKTDQAYERQHLLENFHRLMAADTLAICAGAYLPENAMTGGDYQITFWLENEAGLNQVTYRFDPQEKKVYRSASFWGSKPEEVPVLTGVTQWRIEYFQAKTKNWLTVWQPSRKDEIPALLRFTVATRSADLGELVFPVKVWYNEEKLNGF